MFNAPNLRLASRILAPAFALALFSFSGPSLRAQEKQPLEELDPFAKITKTGPFTADLGTVAKVEVPKGYRFIDKANIKRFNDLTRNLTSPSELGAILPPAGENADWYLIFSYSDEGYVKDDEKDSLDADALLKAMQEGEKEANKQRKQQNMPDLFIVGWEKAPYYDANTHNLTWALKNRCEGEFNVNYQSRLLGRGGSMSATLVCGTGRLGSIVPTYDKLLTGFSYKQGQTYSDWRSGDKVAAYGLGGLVLGGAGVWAAKSGLLAKFGKLIIGGIVAIVGGIGAFFKKIFGRGSAA